MCIRDRGDSTADARRTGFQEGIDGAGGTFLADEVQYADAVADKATVCMEGIMQSHPEGLAIIACHNDDCAIAAARAAANNPAYAKTCLLYTSAPVTAKPPQNALHATSAPTCSLSTIWAPKWVLPLRFPRCTT